MKIPNGSCTENWDDKGPKSKHSILRRFDTIAVHIVLRTFHNRNKQPQAYSMEAATKNFSLV